MRHDDAAVRGVTVLPARPCAACRDDLDIGELESRAVGGGWLEDGYRDGRGVDATAALVRWDALPAMAATFVREQIARGLEGKKARPLVDDFKAKDPSAARR